MIKNFHKWALAVFLLLPSLLHANLIKVNDLGDPSPAVAGNMTLRDAIAAAGPGDTVIMDIKGTINLTSSLMINKPLHIVGAFPVHNTIVLGTNVEIQFNFSGPQIFFSGFRITGSGTSSNPALRVFANTYLVMEDCVLDNVSSTNNGGGVFVSGQLSANYCSFINNQSSLEGGAIYMSNLTYADFNSCTFGTNNAAQGGGAIYCSGSLQVNNCTFANNNSATGGRDIKSNLAGALVTSFNSIYAHTSGGPADFFNGSGSWSSYGGNSFTATPPGGTFTSGTDQTVAAASLGMTSLYTDGYGMRYYRLIPGSVAIDFGLTVGGTLPAKDCRRAPRTLYRTALKPDCGAFEFSPYTVTNTSPISSISGSFTYQLAQINSTANPGPYFVDFGVGAPSTVSSSTPSIITKAQVIIDGYTEAGSSIPGPGIVPGTVSPGVMGYNVTIAAGSDVLDMTATANSFSVSGIGFNGGNYGINSSGSIGFQAFGNTFSGAFQVSLYAFTVNSVTIGGERHFQRNVFTNSGYALNFTQCNNVKIQGNFIGTDNTGMGPAGNENGIGANQVTGFIVGGDHFRGRGNIVSASLYQGMEFYDINNAAICGNYIGLNYNGTGAMENHHNGIFISGSGTGIKIGKAGKDFRNYICNSDLSDLNNGAGIQLGNYTGGDVDIFNNSIGVDKNNVNAPNATGVAIINSNGVMMGDGTIKHRNVVCNSLNNGIYMNGSASSGNYFNKNFIGLKEDNGPGGNDGAGFLVMTVVSNTTIINNVISNNTDAGVQLYTCANNNSVSGNFIGTDSVGVISMPNNYGIYIMNTGTGTILGSNVIAANTLEGIYIENTPGALIKNNIIGLDWPAMSTGMPNARGIRATSCTGLKIGDATGGNTIAANSGNGVEINQCNGFTAVRNFIGTTNTLASFPNLGSGISVINTIGGAIGSATLADSNTIMYNGNGVFVAPGSDHINIIGNHFSQNGGLGISLNGSVPLANDLNDPDGVVYGNQGQNYPVLSGAYNCGGFTKVAGEINVDVADGTMLYRVDFYSIPSGLIDVSGHGEGEHYLTSINLVPAAGMNTLNFSTDMPGAPLSLGTRITATCSKKVSATEFSTSEFSANVMVADPAMPDANALSNVSCNGGSNGSADVTSAAPAPLNYQWFNGGTAVPSGTTPTMTTLTAGDYHCMVSDAVGCVVSSDTITISEPGPLVYTITPTSESCIGENNGSASVIIASGGTAPFTLKFYNGGGSLINTYPGVAYATTVTESSLAAGNFAVLFEDANGCKDSIPFVIAPTTNFVTALMSTSGTSCLGDNMGFADISTGSPAITSWQWDFGDLNTSTAMNPSHGYTATGSYTVQLIVSNGSCDDTVSTLVTVAPAPTVNAGPDLVLCSNTIVFSTLNATVTGSTSYTWTASQIVSWAPDDTSIPTDAYYSGAAVSSGSMYFVLTATAPGCTAVDDTINVTFTPPHSAYAGVDITACSSSPMVLNGAITGSPTAVWSGAGTFSPDATTLTGVTYTPTAGEISAGTATVTLTTDPSGACLTSSDALTITILTTPGANAGIDQTICPGSTATLDGSASTGSITTYQWDEVGGGVAGTGVSVVVNPTVTTSYVLTTDNGVCTDADTVTINITVPPDATFTYASAPYCVNDAAETAVPVIAGGTYGIVGGTTGLGLNASTGEINPAASTPGTYQVYYQLTSPCTNSDTITIIINALPTVSVAEISADYTMCMEDTLNFVGTPAGGSFAALAGLNVTTGEYIGFLAGVGSHTVTYSYTDANGCTASDSKNVTVNAPPAVSFSPTLAASYCVTDGPVLLTGSPSGGGFALNGSVVGLSTYSYDPSTPGTDSIAYGYIDGATGCGNFSYQLVTVISAPPTPILTTSSPYQFCGSSPQTLTVSNPGTTVTWYSDAALSSVITTGVNCSSSLLANGTSTAYVVNETGSGCGSAPLSVTYTNYTFDGFELGGPYTTCAGTPVEIMMTVPSGVTYGWLPDTALTDTAAIHPMVNPTQTNTYTVMLYITPLPSCVMYDSVTVNVTACSLENVTNAFSPDGDGVNDSWIIPGIEQHPNNRVVIFNRWGDKLLQFDGYNNTSTVWDGRYNGAMVASGTYYFVIEYMDDGQQAAGWLQLNY